nr:MAG TPA: hypothetical protein [Caudoviricetes sp.]
MLSDLFSLEASSVTASLSDGVSLTATLSVLFSSPIIFPLFK